MKTFLDRSGRRGPGAHAFQEIRDVIDRRLAETARMWRAKAEACDGADCTPLVAREPRSWRG